MLTHPNGYPLDQWGSDGYGTGCDDAVPRQGNLLDQTALAELISVLSAPSGK